MAKYSRAEIEALSNRLEARAASTMFPDQPNLKADIKARGPVAPADGDAGGYSDR